jgi:tetratricopeptide (TPR) repeat protein
LALAKNPNAPGLHYALGNVYWKKLDFEKAKSEFEKELELAPENYLATWKLGNIHLTKREYDQAFQFLHKALLQKPDLPQARRDLGRALFQTGDFEGSIEQLKTAAKLSPDDSTTHYLLAQAYRKTGRTKELNAELELFGILRDAEQKRNKRPNLSGKEDENKDEPLDLGPPQAQ